MAARGATANRRGGGPCKSVHRPAQALQMQHHRASHTLVADCRTLRATACSSRWDPHHAPYFPMSVDAPACRAELTKLMPRFGAVPARVAAPPPVPQSRLAGGRGQAALPSPTGAPNRPARSSDDPETISSAPDTRRHRARVAPGGDAGEFGRETHNRGRRHGRAAPNAESGPLVSTFPPAAVVRRRGYGASDALSQSNRPTDRQQQYFSRRNCGR
jgi:hypothetical protein